MKKYKEEIAEIGKRVAKRRDELDITQEQLSELFEYARDEFYRGKGIALMDATKISRLENGHLAGLSEEELHLLAHCLEFPPEQLAGANALKNGVTKGDFENENDTQHIFGLMKEYGEKAKELWGWGEFLPCSLETKDFMHAHHEAIFEGLPEKFKNSVVERFDTIGNSRREQVIDKASERSYDFYHLMLLSDVEKIVNAKNEYAGFSKELRIEVLRNLWDLISNPLYRIYLIIAEDEAVKDIRKFFNDFDSRILFDDKLLVCRERSGTVHLTTKENSIEIYRHYFNEFFEKATYRSDKDLDGVLILISDLMKLVRAEN